METQFDSGINISSTNLNGKMSYDFINQSNDNLDFSDELKKSKIALDQEEFKPELEINASRDRKFSGIKESTAFFMSTASLHESKSQAGVMSSHVISKYGMKNLPDYSLQNVKQLNVRGNVSNPKADYVNSSEMTKAPNKVFPEFFKAIKSSRGGVKLFFRSGDTFSTIKYLEVRSQLAGYYKNIKNFFYNGMK